MAEFGSIFPSRIPPAKKHETQRKRNAARASAAVAPEGGACRAWGVRVCEIIYKGSRARSSDQIGGKVG